ncbi:MAG: hypothetical protein ACFFD9_04170, partial [Candidatus Thorarchaeota archaeon]
PSIRKVDSSQRCHPMERSEIRFTREWSYGKVTQWAMLTVALMILQLGTGGPFLPHVAAIAAAIATFVTIVILLIVQFGNSVLTLATLGGILVGILLSLGVLMGGFFLMTMVAIVLLGGTHWIAVLVPGIAQFLGHYLVLFLSFIIEVSLTRWNLDFITRALDIIQTPQSEI